ncbi:MAG TPA: CHAT domain-containing protein [Polyangiaceae bacterium]|nr:CHAT domain-containing protein [Polyangiaceae bacterium]
MATRKALILFLAANPENTTRIKLHEESRAIEQKIRAADGREFFSLKIRLAATVDDLTQGLLEDKPLVMHFSGHGVKDPEGIVLHGERGGHELVKARALKSLFEAVRSKVEVRVVVLNACYSKEQARAIREVVDCVVGMSTAIGDEVACRFAAAFYQGLAFGLHVQGAFKLGLTSIESHNLGEEDVPQLWVKDGVKAEDVILMPGPTPRSGPSPSPAHYWVLVVLVVLSACLAAIVRPLTAKAPDDMSSSIQRAEIRARYAAYCAQRVNAFEGRWPTVPLINTRVVTPSGPGAKPKRFNEIIADEITASNDPSSHSKGLILADGGTGKTVASQAVEADLCQRFLHGDLKRIAVYYDARTDLHRPEARELIDKYVKEVNDALGPVGGQLTVLIDAYDELWFVDPTNADLLLDWSSRLPLKVILLSRPYAVRAGLGGWRTIAENITSNDADYKHQCVVSILFHRFFGPKRRTLPPQIVSDDDEIGPYLAKEAARIESWLSNSGLWENEMNYRDLDIIISAFYRNASSTSSQATNRLGFYYRTFIENRTKDSMGSEFKGSVESLIDCAAALELSAKTSGRVVYKKPSLAPSRDSCKSDSFTIRRAGLDTTTAASPSQDVIAARAICLTECSNFDELDPGLVGRNADEQWVAIAASAEWDCKCPTRISSAATQIKSKEIRQRFMLNQ